MTARWFYLAAGTICIALLCVVPAQDARRQAALFERLAPKIERAQTLSPDTHETISRLVQAARLRTPAGDALHDVRRQTAIDRVANALKAKQVAAADDGNVGLRHAD
jgi:hypothetical protein